MQEDRDWVRTKLQENVPPGDIEEKLISRGYGIKEARDLVEQVQQDLADTTYEEGEGKDEQDANDVEETARLLSPGVRGGVHILVYLLTVATAVFNIWWGRPRYVHFVMIVYSAAGIVMELVGVHIQSILGVGFLGGSWFTQSLHRIKYSNLPWFMVLGIAYILFTGMAVILQVTGTLPALEWALEELMLA